MTSASSTRAAVPPFSSLALNGARILLLLFALFMLAFIRSGVPLYVYVAAVGISLGAVWVTVRESADLKMWAVYLVGFVAFAQLRTLADETGIATQYAYAIDAEKALFFGEVPTVWLQSKFYSFGQIGLLEPLTIMVYVTYFIFPHLVVFAAWRLDRERFPVYAAGVIGVVYAGLLVSVLAPTAPPWLAGQSGELPHVFRVLKDVSNEVTPSTYQAAYETIGPNDVAAMPSLHSAIPAVVAFIAWSRARRPLAVAAWLYMLAMGFSLVYLGEHYVVDVLGGIATALVVTLAITAWMRRTGREPKGDAGGAPAQAAGAAGGGTFKGTVNERAQKGQIK
jgi:membrane-associated phospholipid phosphatase